MRNGIIAADIADYGGADVDALWTVFAQRGMGFFASSQGGDDTAPIESFDVPPAPGSPTGTLSGVVDQLGRRRGPARSDDRRLRSRLRLPRRLRRHDRQSRRLLDQRPGARHLSEHLRDGRGRPLDPEPDHRGWGQPAELDRCP